MVKNKKLKTLICGGSSLLSFLWCKEISNDFDIYLTMNNRKINYLEFPKVEIDVFSVDLIAKAIEEFSFEILINMIGLTNVENCQSNPDLAFLLNAIVPRNLAKACKLTGKKLIHISTDHFFENECYPHSEEDKVSLLNIYAKSKFEGELSILENYSNSLICRTNFFGYGPLHKMSFSDWIINSFISKREITLHNDVYFSPISGGNLAFFAHKLLDLGCSGIFNISSDNVLTKYQFGILLCESLNINSDFIKSDSIYKRDDLVIRPRSMALSNLKISKTIKSHLGTIKEQIASI